jgi:WD40 repeat protein
MLNRLASTAVSAQFVYDLVDDCQAGQVLVLLDCCYSGAYPAGHRPRSPGRVELGHLNDRGRAVITSCTSIEYSFELDTGVVSGKPAASAFTSALISGLRSGAADRDRDGLISVDELYRYIYEEVRRATPLQTPERKYDNLRGDFIVAANPHGPAQSPPPNFATAAEPHRRPAWLSGYRLLVGSSALGAAIATIAFVIFTTLAPSHGGRPHASGSHAVGHLSRYHHHASLTPPVPVENLPDPGVDSLAWSVGFSPDGETLAVGDGDGEVVLWNLISGQTITVLPDPGRSSVSSSVFSPDGKILAVGAGNGRTFLWNVATKKLVEVLRDPVSQGVNAIAFGPGGRTLASGDDDGRAYLWDLATGKIVTTIVDPGGTNVNSLAFGPGYKTLAVGDGDGCTYLWRLSGTKPARILTQPAQTLRDPGNTPVIAVAFRPRSNILAAGDGSGTTYLWNTATGTYRHTLNDPGNRGMQALAFTPSGEYAVTGDANGRAYLWDMHTRSIVETFADPAGEGVQAVAISPNGTRLATADMNSWAYLWPIDPRP